MAEETVDTAEAAKASVHNREADSILLQRSINAGTQQISSVLSRLFVDILATDYLALGLQRETADRRPAVLVAELKELQNERNQAHEELDKLENHLRDASTKADTIERRLDKRVRSSFQSYDDLQLPPVDSKYANFADNNLLRTHGLIAPKDYLLEKRPRVPPPAGNDEPSYLKSTMLADNRSKQALKRLKKGNEKDSINDNIVNDTFPNELDYEVETSSCQSSARQNLRDLNDDSVTRPGLLAKRIRDSDANQSSMFETFIQNAWRGQVSDAERREADEALEKFMRKRNFLRNPRNRPVESSSSMVEVLPPRLEFDNFVPGQKLEASFEVRNIGAISCRHQIIMNSLQKPDPFHIQPADPKSVKDFLAPGLSSKYIVTFKPNSLADLHQVAHVTFGELPQADETSSKVVINSVELHLIACLKKPDIELQPQYELGSFLVGQTYNLNLTFVNRGSGKGNFVVKPSEPLQSGDLTFSCAASNLFAEPNAELHVPFVFNPINSGQFIETFEFVSVENFSEPVKFQLIAQANLLEVTIETVDDEASVWHPKLGDSADCFADAHIRFPTIEPGQTTRRVLSLRTNVNSALQYEWLVRKPILAVLTDESAQYATEPDNAETIVDESNYFFVENSSGQLNTDGTTNIVLHFSALQQRVGNWRSVFCLQLPDVSPDSLLKPRRLGSVLQIEALAETRPFEFSVNPVAISLAEPLEINCPGKAQLWVENRSACSVMFNCPAIGVGEADGSFAIDVQPSNFRLEPGVAALVDLSISARMPMQISAEVKFIASSDNSASLSNSDGTKAMYQQIQQVPVCAKVAPPKVGITNQALDFGLIRLGTSVKRELVIFNNSSSAVAWQLHFAKAVPASNQSSPCDDDVIITQAFGRLAALSEHAVPIIYKPTEVGQQEFLIKLTTEYGSAEALLARADVQMPSITIIPQSKASQQRSLDETSVSDSVVKLRLDEIFCTVEQTLVFRLQNTSALPSHFQWVWDAIEGVNVRFSPAASVIAPLQALDVEITLAIADPGEFVVALTLHVPQQSKTTGVVISGNSLPLLIDYGTSIDNSLEFDLDTSTNQMLSPVLNFNELCNYESGQLKVYSYDRVEQQPSVTVTLTNKTAISAPIRVFSQHSEDISLVAELTGAEAGFIGSSERITLRIALVKANMWGHYTAQVVVCAGELVPSILRFRLHIVGSPIEFLLARGLGQLNNSTAVLHFGSVLSTQTDRVTRTVRLYNSSSSPVRINFKTFAHDESTKNTTGPPHLVDLIAQCGPIGFPVDSVVNDELLGAVEKATALSDTSQQKRRYICLVTRAHDGRECDPDLPAVFSVEPPSLTVGAASYASVTLSMRADAVASDLQPTVDQPVHQLSGHILGYLSLDSADQIACSQPAVDKQSPAWSVSRLQGWDVAPIRMNLRCDLLKPSVVITHVDDDANQFTCAISQMFNFDTSSSSYGQFVDQFIQSKQIQLHNPNATVLSLRISCTSSEGVFLVSTINKKKMSPGHGEVVRGFAQLELTLEAKKSAVVRIDAVVSPLRILATATRPDGAWTQTRSGNSIKRVHTGAVHIDDTSGKHTLETVPLSIAVQMPEFKLADFSQIRDGLLDFGCIYAGSTEVVKEICVVNSTLSDGYFVASIQHDDEERCCFSVTPERGPLRAQLNPLAQNRAYLLISFSGTKAPFVNSPVNALLRIRGLLGEPDLTLRLAATISCDEMFDR